MTATDPNLQPELVFGLVGPIGVDMEAIQSQLATALSAVGYHSHFVRVTELMKLVNVDVELHDSDDPQLHYDSRIRYANAVRTKCEDDAALAALAITAIGNIREDQHQAAGRVAQSSGAPLSEIPIPAGAYIIRQLKRKEEVQLLRQVYGRKFVQISVNLDAKERSRLLANRTGSRNAALSKQQTEEIAEKLVDRDMNELSEEHGQKIVDIFHLGDVFVSAASESKSSSTIQRFIDALFGKNSISPTKDEYGAYIAASASLRSLDISRQVGAAIFTQDGEVIALGSNEVPAAGGGTYWSDHPNPRRDYEEGHEPNSTYKKRILFDTLRRLRAAHFITSDEEDNALFERIAKSSQMDESMLMGITEFGRITHAEMSAILDAARLGRSTKDATLFCTTFPCHNCAKHIVAAGIRRVVYIEPYPKSKAVDLHSDSVSVDDHNPEKVNFEHFTGISPRRYRDIFEKGKRRNKDDVLQTWFERVPVPRIEDKSPYYVYNESSAVIYTLRKVADELGIEIPEQT